MRASRSWENGVSVKNLGEISKTKKVKIVKKSQKEDICLNCKEEKCNKGTCKEFKK